MTIASIAICTRLGSPIFVRNYVAISQSRLESLLLSFPRLLSPGQQHSFVESEEARFLFQPLQDQLYLVLLTTKTSNLLADLETLQLASRVVSHLCEEGREADILDTFGELMFAFDELVTATQAETLTLPQITTNLAMESQEEALQELIEKNKIQEAREVGKQKMKQLELAKREGAARKGAHSGFGMSSPSASMDTVHVATEAIDTNTTSATDSFNAGTNKLKSLKTGKGMSLKKY